MIVFVRIDQELPLVLFELFSCIFLEVIIAKLKTLIEPYVD